MAFRSQLKIPFGDIEHAGSVLKTKWVMPKHTKGL